MRICSALRQGVIRDAGRRCGIQRKLIRTRTSEGRARALANAVSLGHKPMLTHHQQQEAIKPHNAGKESQGQSARSYNVSRWTILTRRRACVDPTGSNSAGNAAAFLCGGDALAVMRIERKKANDTTRIRRPVTGDFKDIRVFSRVISPPSSKEVAFAADASM
jgi:hypothetical protein